MLSGLYALIAIGFTLIFGVGGVLNLAHGASIVMGAFSYFGARAIGLGVLPSALAAVVVPGLVMGAVYLVMIRRFDDEPIMVLILTLVFAVVVEQVVLNLVGASPNVLSITSGTVAVLGVSFTITRVLMFAISVALVGLLIAFVNYTRVGRAVVATSQSRKGASLVGIDSGRINLLIWMLAGAFAGLAGLFLGATQGASFRMGREPLVLAFSIVVVGGIGSIRGSVLGAFIVGFAEVITVSVISSKLSGLASLVILVVVLLVKPEGLFGHELAE